MKKNILKKILRIKVTLIAALFILVVAALQTPWVKSHIVKKLSTELSSLTDSEVSVKEYDGFLPISFDLYSIEFKQEDKLWLKVDKLSLNRSFFYFLFWKNKGLDLSVDGATLFSNPKKESSGDWKWPRVPYTSLNIELSGKNLMVAEEVFNHKIPPHLRLKSTLHLAREGSSISFKGKLTSDELLKTSFKFNLRGFEKKNTLHISANLEDPEKELSSFLEKPWPAGELKINLSGAPEAFLGFTKTQSRVEDSFRGSLNSSLFLDDHALLSDGKLSLSFDVYFDQEGLSVEEIKIKSDNINFKGSGFLARNYHFNSTSLEGKINDLDFTKMWFPAPLEGELNSSVEVRGYYQSPTFDLKVNSPHLAYQHYIAYDFKSDILIEKVEDKYQGLFKLSSSLNQSPLSVRGLYDFCNFKQCHFQNVTATYGNNTLYLHSFRKLKHTYQSTLDFDLKKVSLLSPLIKKEIHGDAKGQLTLDVDVTQQGLIQTLSTTFSGSIFDISSFNISDYSFMTKGVLNWENIKDYSGEFTLSSGLSKTKKYHWESINAYVKLAPSSYQYKAHLTGEVSILSSGQIEKEKGLWKASIRHLSGKIVDHPYHLIRPTFIDYQKKLPSF